MGSCRRCQAGGRLERAPEQVGIRSGGHTGVGKCDHRSDEWSTEQAGFRVIAQMSGQQDGRRVVGALGSQGQRGRDTERLP